MVSSTRGVAQPVACVTRTRCSQTGLVGRITWLRGGIGRLLGGFTRILSGVGQTLDCLGNLVSGVRES